MTARPAPILPLALFLAVLLTAGWTAIAWRDLIALHLPDTDDMARLAQIRDWLGGQAFSDLSQHRLGPPGGTAMHWSRLPDLVPALLITMLTPLLGAHRAQVAAVIFWPELLFLLHLLLAAALACRLAGPRAAPTAVLLAGLAYPAISLFIPGRIDHHGLQIVLVECVALALTRGRLFAAGIAAGASLLIGLETAPPILAAMAALAWLWTRDARPVAGFGFGLLAAALAGALALRPQVWPGDWCDSFTPGLFALMLIAGGGWLVLGGVASRLPDWRWRAGALVGLGMLALGLAAGAAPACFASPYGRVDPLLAQVWLDKVGEAGGVLRQTPGTLIAYLGLPVAGLIAASRFAVDDAERRNLWVLLALMIGASVATALFQMRGAYFGAALAAPVLARFVTGARAEGTSRRIVAWLVSAGLVWQGLGGLIDGAFAGTPAPPGSAPCASPRTLEQLDRLPAGTLAAPIDFGAYALGATRHRVLAGPYHRNNAGNRAMYGFFLSSPDQARYQAGLWAIDYVVMCPGAFDEVPKAMLKPTSLAAKLRRGETPDWLDPVLLVGGTARLWRVRDEARP